MRPPLRLIPVFVLALTLSAWADPAVLWPPPQRPAGTPVPTFPLPRVDWFAHFERNLHQAQAGPVDLIFDGDSITDFFQNGKGKAVWQERYVPLDALDLGIGGDRVENLLWRIDHGELDGLHPKLIVLMIGTNNHHDSVEDVADGIKLAVASYRSHCPGAHLLLLGIFPRGASLTDPGRVRNARINQIISKLDDGKNITYLDIGAKFLQPGGTLTEEIMTGLLHPTEKGYRIWADAIQPVVDQYCPKSAVTPATTPVPAISRKPITVAFPLPPRPADTATPSFPVPQLRWIDDFQQNQLDRLKNGPYELVFDGDEITQYLTGQADADVWKPRYGRMKTLNLGSTGDQVQMLLWRVQHGDLAGQDPKLIVLMIGGWNIYYSHKPEDVAAGIKLVLNEYETRCPDAHILLLGIFPRGTENRPGLREGIARTNQILSTYADGKRVTYMDVGSKFLRPDGTINPDLMFDALRPSTKGYQVWADAIQPVIDRYFPKTATN